jgi:ribosomal protein S18 acetylase RimI-like enzyme
MNAIRAATTRMLTVRSMEPRDLPRLVHIEKLTPTPRWTQNHFKTDLQAPDRINLVATVKNYVVGFVISRLISASDTPQGGADRRGEADGNTDPDAVFINLLHLAVAPDWRRRGVASTLLAQLEQFLREPHDSIRAAVPEGNLPIQLALRSGGYKALRVLRGFYTTEDAYLMERRRG